MKLNPLAKGVAISMVALSGSLIAQAQADAIAPKLPNAKPGECYARVLIPAEYRSVADEVVVREAAQRVEIVPARYEWTEEKIRVEEASYRLETLPTVYDTVSEKVEVSSARRIWTSGLSKREASTALLEAAMKMGVNDNVNAGTCFHEYLEPAKFRTTSDQVLKKEASEKLVTTPAKYEWAEEKVLVKEASTRMVEVPAVYETEYEEVLIEAARQEWKKGRGPKERIDDSTGEILCLIEIPAKYKRVAKRVLKSPATTRQIEIPAVYKTQKVRRLAAEPEIKRIEVPAEYSSVSRREKVSDDTYYWYRDDASNTQGTRTGNQLCLQEFPAQYKTVTRTVVKTPASTRRIEIPAVYNNVRVRKLVSPAAERRIDIPQETRSITRREMVSDERLEWRQILCDTNLTDDVVRRIQRALLAEGYNPGPIDGVVGHETLAAVSAFQRARKLPRGGLTMTTLQALKINI